MADYRKILGLLLEGRSYREVVEIAGCSHRDVARVRQEVQERGLTASGIRLSGRPHVTRR